MQPCTLLLTNLPFLLALQTCVLHSCKQQSQTCCLNAVQSNSGKCRIFWTGRGKVCCTVTIYIITVYPRMNISFMQVFVEILLTQNCQVGFGCSDGHGEERTGVHAFIGQCDITDTDGQLRPRCTHQLNPVVP